MRLTNDCVNTFVSVPNIFIDNYMTKASGEFIKVYLYLLRCMQSGLDISLSDIANDCSLTENDVLCALIYWDKANVLSLEIDEKKIAGIRFMDLNAVNKEKADISTAASPNTKTIKTTPTMMPPSSASVSADIQSNITAETKSFSPAHREYTLDEVKAFCSNPDISELLFVLETYIKHPLSSTEMNVVFFWMNELKFSKELAEYLIEYCVSGGHISIRYMEKVAINWAESDISTIEEAKQLTAIHSKACYTVMKSFGINGRNLTDNEIAFVTKWTKEYAFDLTIIQEACKRTISATQKPSFEYTDSILTSWKNKNVHTIKDITNVDAAYNKTKKANFAANNTNVSRNKFNKFNNFNQRTYDYDELEKLLLTTSVQ